MSFYEIAVVFAKIGGIIAFFIGNYGCFSTDYISFSNNFIDTSVLSGLNINLFGGRVITVVVSNLPFAFGDLFFELTIGMIPVKMPETTAFGSPYKGIIL